MRKGNLLELHSKMVSAYAENRMQNMNTLHVTMWSFVMLL